MLGKKGRIVRNDEKRKQHIKTHTKDSATTLTEANGDEANLKETRCWSCNRTENEVREFMKPVFEFRGEELPIFEKIDLIDYNVSLCLVCRDLFVAMLVDRLKNIIQGDPTEILTTEDLEKLKLKISYEERSIPNA